MDPSHNPLFQYCLGLMEARNQDSRLIPVGETQSLISIAKVPINNVNEIIIALIASILVRHKFLAVFRPSDVKALMFLRDHMSWKGYPMLFRVSGNLSVFRDAFDALRKENFSIFCYGVLIYPGDLNSPCVGTEQPPDPDPEVIIVDEDPQPDPNISAYNSGFNHGQNLFNETVVNAPGCRNDQGVDNFGMQTLNNAAFLNNFINGWKDGVDFAAAGNDGNPISFSRYPVAFRGFEFQVGDNLNAAILSRMNLNTALITPLHPGFNPFNLSNGNAFNYGTPFFYL